MAEGKNKISINLNCYTIRFRHRNKKDTYLPFAEVFGSKQFTDIIQELVKTLDSGNVFKNGNEDRILYLERTLSASSTSFTGIIRKGYSGHQTYIDELKNEKVFTLSTVGRDKYNSTPFFMLLNQPDLNCDYLIFLAQSYKQFGFKEVFEEAFKSYFDEKYDNDIICEFATLAIASLFERYIREGNIRKLRFKKHRLPKHLENVLSEEDNGDNDNYEVELAIKAKKGGFLGIKNDIQFDDSSFIEMIKLDGFNYDEAFADLSIGGRSRSLNVTTPSKFSASFDLTREADIDELTNHPNFEKLNEEAFKILTEEILPNLNL